MLADRADSFDSGSKKERKKILCQNVNGPILGCAGDSRFIENFFAEIQSKWETSEGDSYDRFRSIYEPLIVETYKLNQLTGAKIDPSIETILVEVQDGRIISFFAEGLSRSRPVECTSIIAIPEEFPEMQPYLEINSRDLSEDEAVKLGEEILRQMCFSNYLIGPPEYHGYDYVKIRPTGALEGEKNPSLHRLGPAQLINKVRVEEEEA
jgi:hypothetical protein